MKSLENSCSVALEQDRNIGTPKIVSKNFHLDEELAEMLRHFAFRCQVSQTAIVRRALRKFILEENEKASRE